MIDYENVLGSLLFLVELQWLFLRMAAFKVGKLKEDGRVQDARDGKKFEDMRGSTVYAIVWPGFSVIRSEERAGRHAYRQLICD